MTIRLYNTASKKNEDFKNLSGNTVKVYTCGPTVYDYPHIGNWASFIYWDILVRMLTQSGYQVERVMNITDVGHLVSDADDGEDKLEKGAKREGKTAWEIADFYTNDFLDGIKKLNLLPPTHLIRATDYIDQQLLLVESLKNKGYTYQISDGIYFDTSKFKRYADFAQLDLKSQLAGARVKQNTEKRQPWDFALWKFTKPGQKRDMEWQTPQSLIDLPLQNGEVIMGFPGWHLECSAIAMSLLGNTLDIHTGGIDHVPVHHTNEIAQSESLTGVPFSNYWIHNNHLKIEGSKISKSIGNGYTLQDLEKRGFNALDFKMFVLQGQYTNEGNFSFQNLESAKNRLNNWKNIARLRHQIHNNQKKEDSLPKPASKSAIINALQDNLNTPKALSVIDEIFSELEKPINLSKINKSSLIELLELIDDTLGLNVLHCTPDVSDEIKKIILARLRARDIKDFALADELRQELNSYNIGLRDTKNNSIWYAD